MRKKLVLKIAGASGQGINTVGEILGKALKREGYGVVAYREYPSLIKGGHATYQIEASLGNVHAISKYIDVAIILNKQATNWHLDELNSGGVIVHDIPNPRINSTELKIIQEKKIKFIFVPAGFLAKTAGGSEIMSNTVISAVLSSLIGISDAVLQDIIKETFADKEKYIPVNLECIKLGYQYPVKLQSPEMPPRLQKPDEIQDEEKANLHILDSILVNDLRLEEISDSKKLGIEEKLLLTGNDALSIGALAAGMRIYYSYPMTPSSSIISYLADTQDQTGIIVKQAEDEITAAAMTVGSMHMGARSMTGTSGGGFDLMTEHISLSAITEIPFVCILAQRPGPATGLPTWTAQSDLFLAIFSSHGEFPRCVIAPGDLAGCYLAIQEAFNIAETYQIPVIVLTDKFLAETLFVVSQDKLQTIEIQRGLIPDDEQVTSSDRYKNTESGISKRWLPGSRTEDYNANSDEHDDEGNVTEDARVARDMTAKRQQKLETLAQNLPKPEIIYNNVDLQNAKKKIRLIGWGSTINSVKDVMQHYEKLNIKVDYLDLIYLWPFPAGTVKSYIEDSEDVLLIEGNNTGQLAQLIRMQTGIEIKKKLLKWNGRPFYNEEIIAAIDREFNIS